MSDQTERRLQEQLKGAANELETDVSRFPDFDEVITRGLRARRRERAVRLGSQITALVAIAVVATLAVSLQARDRADDVADSEPDSQRTDVASREAPGARAGEKESGNQDASSDSRSGTSNSSDPAPRRESSGATGSAELAGANPARASEDSRGCEPAPSMEPPDGMSVKLELSETAVAPNEGIRMTLRVRNNGLLPVENSRGWREYDFWVEGSDGTIWLWSYDPDAATPQVLVRESFAPGEERVRTEVWKQTTCFESGSPPPGEYVARALWGTGEETSDGFREGGWWSNPVQLVIR